MGNRRRATNPGAAEPLGLGPVDGVNGDDVLMACVDMVGRLGASAFDSRYSDDQEPVVWMAGACFADGRFEVDAAVTPQLAAWRLIERLVDGGQCQHCHRPTGVTLDLREQPAERLICWYQYDPELKRFRRGCEGDT